MSTLVISVPVTVGEVQAADEGDFVVDHHDLLVMGTDEMLTWIQSHPHARSSHKVVPDSTDIAPVGPDHRNRRTRPQQHTDIDAARDIRQQLTDDDRVNATGQREAWSDRPAGDVDMTASRPDRLLDPGQYLRSVDQHLKLVSRPRWRIAAGPQRSTGRGKALSVPKPRQASVVGDDDSSFDRVAKNPVAYANGALKHAPILTPHA
jgi:hypothetical protein